MKACNDLKISSTLGLKT